MLVISCHADTNFRAHDLRRGRDGSVHGHLDNFAGVYAVMQAYFSGRLAGGHVRIELTHGEETSFAGAREVFPTLHPEDVVVVVDVTGVPTTAPITIEKCRQPQLASHLRELLGDLPVDVNPAAADPIADADESDIYSLRCRDTFFLGVVCSGGDYNEGAVDCSPRSLDAACEALCRIAEDHHEWCRIRPTFAERVRARATVRVRRPREADFAAWQRLREALWPDCTADELPDALAAGAVFVAELGDGSLAGFCELSLRDSAEGCESSPVGYLEGWYVDERSRRQGIGAALLQAGEDWARAGGASEFASDAASDNLLSQLAHEALGFSHELELVCYRKSLA